MTRALDEEKDKMMRWSNAKPGSRESDVLDRWVTFNRARYFEQRESVYSGNDQSVQVAKRAVYTTATSAYTGKTEGKTYPDERGSHFF